ncbi:Holliday junction branch migration protein RuvA [Rickettsiales endosymbiont of Trichoplax sp. H2]|uniref:Holliday junction branch migration protein RuvA n=1 Tax=Rickettsiales endosymbiont of Trichoplax sp. H2 TaxID=2021221 RepID=UPI0012B3A911|nr:Holliday junction branch migration protein RuvA [Rickettsiales endosymbiont of Trichoplax sp. H2]MSO13262.1 Holliday junction ATP-dependent DNA helicase RuvA [Rickettsiales endosymbiont of Trichoplax sp. H2]
MIGKLFGEVCDIASDHIIVNVNGVGYIVFCSGRTISKYNIGDKIELITQTIVKENDISIFGFVNSIDKEFFNHLLTIQGVGAKLAQTIIGSLDVNEIIQSVQINDNTKFTQISGVGPKLAARLVNELKNKKFISKLQNIKMKQEINTSDNSQSQIILDATSALSNLGYAETQINSAINQIISDKADLENLKLDILIKDCIKVLSS